VATVKNLDTHTIYPILVDQPFSEYMHIMQTNKNVRLIYV